MSRPDARIASEPVLGALAEALRPHVLGLYVGGSLATGTYRPGISDIDAVALLERPPTRAGRAQLVAAHRRLIALGENAAAVHCTYVPVGFAHEVGRRHWTWAFGALFRRSLSGIARAELLAEPIVLLGPEPATWLPAMDLESIRAAARAELTGYWAGALRRPRVWEQDSMVDLGLTVWARAEEAMSTGRLISKDEAIARLTDGGLPASIVDGVRARRAGEQTAVTADERRQRAVLVRRFLTDRVRALEARTDL